MCVCVSVRGCSCVEGVCESVGFQDKCLLESGEKVLIFFCNIIIFMF
jgi:hypothetical protein